MRSMMERSTFSKVKLDFRKKQPLAEQLKDAFLQRIHAGEIQPGEQLPTVRLLAAQLGINFNTVARAYRVLDEAGLISTQQGRGTYIWEMPSETAANSRRRRLTSSNWLISIRNCRTRCP